MKTKQYRNSRDDFKIAKAPTFVEDSSKDLKNVKKQIKKKLRKMLSVLLRHKQNYMLVTNIAFYLSFKEWMQPEKIA